MIAFIKDHRGAHGVEPICRVLQIAPSTFYERIAIERDPDRASDRAKRDAHLRKKMKDVWEKNRSVYGARKLWHAMKREKINIARCTVERSPLVTLLCNALPGNGCASLAFKASGAARRLKPPMVSLQISAPWTR